MTENQLLTARQVGLLLALSQRQIYRLNSCGKLPRPVRIGGAVRWKLADISRWQELQYPDRLEFEAKRKAGTGERDVLSTGKGPVQSSQASRDMATAGEILLRIGQADEKDGYLRQAYWEELEKILRRHYERR